MDLYIYWLVLLIHTPVSHTAVVLRPLSSINIPYAYEADGQTGIYGIYKGAVEQSAYDVESRLVYAAGSAFIHIIDYSNVTNPVILDSISSRPINYVEQCGSRVAFALTGDTRDQPGEVHVYNVYSRTTKRFDMDYPPITVGFKPDMLHFTKDCNTIVVADEGTPVETPTDVLDPPGSVTIIRLNQSPLVVKTLDFAAFNDRANDYVSQGVRWHYRGEISSRPSNFSQSLEPEYVTFNKDESKAYIALQENNAIAEVNLITDTIEEVYPLGVKSWRDLGLDASDKDSGINLRSYDIVSLYQPDSITSFEFNNNTYIVTGNEGDQLELEAGGQEWADVKRGKKIVQDGQISAHVDSDLQAALADDSRLGRLEFSLIDGLDPSDPTKISRPHFFGGRGISVFRADDMTLVWDSDDMMAKLQSELYPSTFNGNSRPDDPDTETPNDLKDKRSDNKGPECEELTIGELDDNTRLLFVGIGRVSSIAIFRIEASFDGGHEPVLKYESMFRAGGTNETFSFLLDNNNIGNLDPEDLRFIKAQDSPTGSPLLLATGTTSGTLVMYEVVDEDLPDNGPGCKCVQWPASDKIIGPKTRKSRQYRKHRKIH